MISDTNCVLQRLVENFYGLLNEDHNNVIIPDQKLLPVICGVVDRHFLNIFYFQ